MSTSGSGKKRPAPGRGPHPQQQQEQPTTSAISAFFAPRKKAQTEIQTRTSTGSEVPSHPSHTATTIFVDLDGVLVDFDQGVQTLTGQSSKAVSSAQLWSAIARADHFYRTLPWTRDGEELWETLRQQQPHLRPSILTGVPRTQSESAARDKHAWCQRELCVETVHWNKAGPKMSHAALSKQDKRRGDTIWCKVITCWSRNKHLESGPGRVLIDDREDLREPWEARGGIFVLHVNTEQTLRTLRQLKILPPSTALQQTESATQEPDALKPSLSSQDKVDSVLTVIKDTSAMKLPLQESETVTSSVA